MSPVARRQGGTHTGKAVLTAIVGVSVALGVAFLVANLASRGDIEVRIGDDRFEDVNAADILDEIQDEDAPVLFPDVATGRRPVQLDNLGDDPDEGWVAFLAVVPDQPDCAVNWDRDDKLYRSSCDESTTFPRTGDGLRAFPVEVVDGKVIVDLQDQDQ